MDITRREITELSYKVEQLYEIVERISQKIVLLHPDQEDSFQENLREPHNLVDNNSKYNSSYKSISPQRRLKTEHKDILEDEDNSSYDYRSGNSHHPHHILPIDAKMSYELEIQRLTAQLTAAYHRIAALEEQLLANRSQTTLDRVNNR